MKYKPKEIYCPKCNKRLGKYDGKETDAKFYQFQCSNCNIRILYDLSAEQIEIKPVPYKITAFGKVPC